jgi:D-alanine transaminase
MIKRISHLGIAVRSALMFPMLVYFNGAYVQKPEVAISPDDRGFLFADGIYEVIRVYRGKLFKCPEHLERMAYGMKELKITGCAPQGLESAAIRVLNENGLENSDAKIYIQITRGAAPRGHKFPPEGTPPTVYLEATPFTPPTELQEKGAAAIIVPDQRWARCDIKTISLLPNVLANQQAIDVGAHEAIFRRDGVLHEGSHSSILFVKNNILIAPPLTSFVLPSVTRNVVLSLAHEESIRTTYEPCLERELWNFQEILMVGTGSEIIPITIVNGRKIGNGSPGPITRKLQDAFRILVSSDSH